jgi:hypothetical protein
VARVRQPAQPAIAEAIADVAHSAQRIVEERIELLRLEVRHDMRRLLRASALGASGVVALAVAMGMAAGSVTWTLALWVPFGAALGITAAVTAVAGVILGRMARMRLPGAGPNASESDEPTDVLAPAERGRVLGPAEHESRDAGVSTT